MPDHQNHYQYEPSLPVAIIALVLWVAISAWAIRLIHRDRLRYFIIFAVGAVGEAIGYVARVYGCHDPYNFGGFLIMELFLVCSPLAFMAGDYVVYGRLVRYFGEEYGIIPTKYVAAVFVTCDITSFIMQGGGAGLLVSSDLHTVQIGKDVMLTGLAFGLASFGTFAGLVTIFLYRIRRTEKAKPLAHPGLTDNWKHILIPMYISIACIIIRTIYRLVEFSYGWTGVVNTTEWYLYVFDCLFMLIATVIYLCYWPANYGLGSTIPSLQSLRNSSADTIPMQTPDKSNVTKDNSSLVTNVQNDVNLPKEDHPPVIHVQNDVNLPKEESSLV